MTYGPDHSGLENYTRVVYDHGAATLAESRRRVQADHFNTALQSYITANALQLATPDDVARAYADQPAVLDPVTRAGRPTRPTDPSEISSADHLVSRSSLMR